MSIYLTQQKKEELEAKLGLLKNSSPLDREEGQYIEGKIFMLESILNDVVILPVEESWYEVKQSVVLENNYPNGFKPIVFDDDRVGLKK